MSILHNRHLIYRNILTNLLVEHRQALLRTARVLVGCQHRAEDVVQDVFVKLYSADQTTVIQQPVSYLHRMVRNQAIDYLRRVQLEQRHATQQHTHEPDEWWADHNPESTLAQQQILTQVQQCLQHLPQRTQQTFMLHRVLGYSQKEIAAQLGVSPTLVNFMIKDAHQCCVEARQCLEQE